MLAEDVPSTAILGGGTVVMPRLSTGAERPGRLLDLAAAPGLAEVATASGTSTLGATVTYATLLHRPVHRLLTQVARGITGGPQIRNQGTIGGSLCSPTLPLTSPPR
jgi:CO/xanthine dehydrogenase FAD-binding subunit